MNGLSIMGLGLSLILVITFLYQSAMLIRTINKKEKNKIGMYLLGVIASLLLSVITVVTTFNIAITIPGYLYIIACIIGFLFFFIGGLDSVKVEKK